MCLLISETCLEFHLILMNSLAPFSFYVSLSNSFFCDERTWVPFSTPEYPLLSAGEPDKRVKPMNPAQGPSPGTQKGLSRAVNL